MPQNYLALDLGAESGRAILGSFRNDKLKLEEIHRFANKQIQRDTHIHWDIQHLFNEIKCGFLKAAESGNNQLGGISVDTWGVDFGLLDEKDQLVDDPVIYRDARTNGMMERAFALMPEEELYRHTGTQMLQINSVFQFLSLVLSKDAGLQKTKTMLLMPDLFHFFLTGKKTCEYTMASTTQMLDARSKKWSEAVFAKLNLSRNIMPDVVAPGTKVGTLLPEICSETGLPGVDVIAAGGHDTACAVCAVPARGENWAYISSGTWSLVGVELDEPILDERGLKNRFTNEGGINGKIRFLRNAMGLWLLQRCQKQWTAEGEKTGYGELVKLAEQAPAFQCWLDPDDSTFLNPPNMPEAIVNFCKRTNQIPPADKAQFVRTILESLALRYRYIIEIIKDVRGKNLDAIHVVGGGCKNELLNQFTADATGLPVIAGPVEATSAGNIISQAIAKGEIRSFDEGRGLIARSFPTKTFMPKDTGRWDEIYNQVKSHLS